jgi:hypothetical protein
MKEIDRYLQCRKAGLERLSWFIDDDEKLIMDVNRELKDLRKEQLNTPGQVGKDRERQYNSLRLFKHLSSNAPDDINGIIPADAPIHYDDPFNNKFSQELPYNLAYKTPLCLKTPLAYKTPLKRGQMTRPNKICMAHRPFT